MSLVDQKLAENDVLGIVSQRRFDRKKWEETRYARKKKFNEEVTRRVATLLAQGPMFKRAVDNLVNAQLKAEVSRIIEARLEQRRQEIADLHRPNGPPLKLIMETVEEVTGVAVADLCGPRRQRDLAWPRHFGFHMVKLLRTDLSLPAIGRAFGNRDHTTIMHGLKKVALLADQSPFREWLMHPSTHALLGWKADEQ